MCLKIRNKTQLAIECFVKARELIKSKPCLYYNESYTVDNQEYYNEPPLFFALKKRLKLDTTVSDNVKTYVLKLLGYTKSTRLLINDFHFTVYYKGAELSQYALNCFVRYYKADTNKVQYEYKNKNTSGSFCVKPVQEPYYTKQSVVINQDIVAVRQEQEQEQEPQHEKSLSNLKERVHYTTDPAIEPFYTNEEKLKKHGYIINNSIDSNSSNSNTSLPIL